MGTGARISRKPIKLHDLGRHGDHISYLHEDVLSNILSRLPTKEAIRTSILSKAWEYKWTSVYNVDIDDTSIVYSDRRLKAGMFANFVDRILRSCEHVKKFRLLCNTCYELDRAQTWIFAALRHKLESLEVRCDVKGTVYPCSLLNSTSLRNLEVFNCTLNVAGKNIAANLTSLWLNKVKIVNENPNTSTVTFIFPVLETIKLKLCEWLNVKTVEIDAPLLTTYSSTTVNDSEEYDYSFIITAPRLAKFESRYGFPEKIVLHGPSVVSATIFCESEVQDLQLLASIGTQVGNLLNGFTNLEKLELTDFIAEVLRLGPPLRCHGKLRRIDVVGSLNPGILCHLLRSAPSLKFLQVLTVDDCDWEMETMPSCIVSQLEEVEFVLGDLCTTRYNFAKFLLKHAERLKRIHVCFGTRYKFSSRRDAVIHNLLKFPRCSPSLIIE